MPTTREYIENIDPAEWPQQTVACQTPGCPNEGLELEVPDIGQNVQCGACGQLIVQLHPGRG